MMGDILDKNIVMFKIKIVCFCSVTIWIFGPTDSDSFEESLSHPSGYG